MIANMRDREDLPYLRDSVSTGTKGYKLAMSIFQLKIRQSFPKLQGVGF